MKRTKIVCTIGPSSESEEKLRELILAGMNVARINFSHGDYHDQAEKVENIKKVREELGLPVALLLDTKGPEIRTGKFENGSVCLEAGSTFTLVTEEIMGNHERVHITYPDLYKDVSVGSTILVDDGNIELTVKEIQGTNIVCEVINGENIKDRRGINVPNIKINLPSITDKDIKDIKDGITAGFDYIAASFIRKAEDVLAIRDILKQNNGSHIKIISKIENREGIDNFAQILEVSDGIMIARGDMGVEIPMEEVPVVQKRFIKQTRCAGKPVITATQMLETMIENPRPTRAEVSDVANAIYDGSSAIMLSGETANGKYPVECVKAMTRIAETVEANTNYWSRFSRRRYHLDELDYEFNINYAVCNAAMNIGATAIFAFTESGDTPRILSSLGPTCSIFAVTESEVAYRQLSLMWGVFPKLFSHKETINDLLMAGIEKVKEEGSVKEGDMVLIAGGSTAILNDSYKEVNRMMGGVVKV